jgi:hypothetical protein
LRASGSYVTDGSAHGKQGTKTPGMRWQWCGEMSKVENCIIDQHLLNTDNDAKNALKLHAGQRLRVATGALFNHRGVQPCPPER